MLVLAVGENSEWGRTMALVVGEVGSTPLLETLGWLAGGRGASFWAARSADTLPRGWELLPVAAPG